jgi:hypothetical protein
MVTTARADDHEVRAEVARTVDDRGRRPAMEHVALDRSIGGAETFDGVAHRVVGVRLDRLIKFWRESGAAIPRPRHRRHGRFDHAQDPHGRPLGQAIAAASSTPSVEPAEPS